MNKKKRIKLLGLITCVLFFSTLYLSLPRFNGKASFLALDNPGSNTGINNGMNAGWKSEEESYQSGLAQRPQPILEISYLSRQQFPEDSPEVTIIGVVKKNNGQVPTYPDLEGSNIYKIETLNVDTVVNSYEFALTHFLNAYPPSNGEPLEPQFKEEVGGIINFPWNEAITNIRILNPQGGIIEVLPLKGYRTENNQADFQSISGKEAKETQSKKSSIFSFPRAHATSGVFDITFVGDDYTDMSLFHADVEKYINNFLAFQPFKSRASQIAFHYVDSNDDLLCNNTYGYVECNDNAAISAVNKTGVPWDKIVVIWNSAIWGGSAYLNGQVASCSRGTAVTCPMHELGHTLGLKDEYNTSNSNGTISNSIPYGFANCYAGLPTSNTWEGTVANSDYSAGCYYPNWYRTSANSVMNNGGLHFNAVSQIYLKNRFDAITGLFTDSSPPAASISTPANNANASGNLTVTASLSDNTGIAWTDLYLDGTLYKTDYDSPWSFTVATNKLDNGSHTIQVKTRDVNNNTNTSLPVSIKVNNNLSTDTVPPTLSFSSPNNGDTISGTTVLRFNTSDNIGVVSVTVKDGETVLGTAIGPTYYLHRWNTLNTTSGSHTLTAIAKDAANNTIDAQITVDVDNTNTDITPPIVSVGADKLARSATSLSGAAVPDPSGIASYTWTKEAGPGTVTFTEPQKQSTTFIAYSDGVYTTRLTVTDNAGNNGYDELDVTWDTTPPTVNAGTDKNTAAQFTQSGSATDNGSGIASYAWTKQSGPGTVTFGSANAINTTISANQSGVYVIRLTVTDRAGNVGYDEMTVAWNSSAPVVNAGIDKISRLPFTQSGSATDNGSGIASYAWTKQSGPGTVTFGSANSANTAISTNQDGVYVLRLTATNALGNSSYDEMTLTWDTTPPTVNAGADASSKTAFTQSGSATDSGSGIATYAWTKQSGPGTITFGTPNTPSTTVSANLNGVYVLRLTVTDNVGISAFDEITLTWTATNLVVNINSGNRSIYPGINLPLKAAAVDTVSLNWTQQSGPGTLTFSSTNTDTTTVKASTPGVYVIRFTGTDQYNATAYQEITLTVYKSGDINNDGKVDLNDFTLLMFNWGTPANNMADLNSDNQSDLNDFTILMYWWTG